MMKFQRFMQGRYGIDVLGKHLTNLTFVLLVVNLFFRNVVLNALVLILAIYVNFRMFSKKTYKRSSENRMYVQWLRKFKSKTTRIKESRKYKYFKCPECSLNLRAPRKRGVIIVTCSNCKHKFEVKT